MTSKIILGVIIAIAFLAGTITTGIVVSAASLTENPEPLTQIVTYSFENNQSFYSSIDITSTGSMIVDVCGELRSPHGVIGAGASIDVRNVDAGNTDVSMVSTDETDEIVTGCLTIGADAEEMIKITHSATLAGNPSLKGHFTVRTTPSADLTIVES